MHFYPGIAPMTWLGKTPIAVIRACQRMMPRLEARDALRQVYRGAVAAGRVEKPTSDRLMDEWERAANPTPAARTPAKPVRRQVNPSGMRRLGIGVRTVKRRG
jgi:hypothetical protein